MMVVIVMMITAVLRMLMMVLTKMIRGNHDDENVDGYDVITDEKLMLMMTLMISVTEHSGVDILHGILLCHYRHFYGSHTYNALHFPLWQIFHCSALLLFSLFHLVWLSALCFADGLYSIDCALFHFVTCIDSCFQLLYSFI